MTLKQKGYDNNNNSQLSCKLTIKNSKNFRSLNSQDEFNFFGDVTDRSNDRCFDTIYCYI